jgi:hypothetical protein
MAYQKARSILNRPKVTGSTGNLDRAHNLPITKSNLGSSAGFVTSARRASHSKSGEMISRRAHQVTFHKSLDYEHIICFMKTPSPWVCSELNGLSGKPYSIFVTFVVKAKHRFEKELFLLSYLKTYSR